MEVWFIGANGSVQDKIEDATKKSRDFGDSAWLGRLWNRITLLPRPRWAGVVVVVPALLALTDRHLAMAPLALVISTGTASLALSALALQLYFLARIALMAVVDPQSTSLQRSEAFRLLTGPRPFVEAAAEAMGIDKLRVIDTGLDPVTAEREQWDDGNNTLALAPRVAVAYERNDETNDRLEEAGIEVVRIAGSELGSGRGGPRCMSCPIERDPLPA